MEITEINMIGDFEAGIKCLQNPSLISRFSPVPQLYSFWKWGALFLAIFSTFTSLLRKIKLLIIHRINSWVSPSKPLLNQLLAGDDDDFDFSDDDEVSSSSSVSDDDDDDEDEDVDYTSSFENRNRNRNKKDEDFCVAGTNCFSELHGQNGNCGLRRRNGFSWSDFSAGKSVVKLWDSFGFALDFEESYVDEGDEVSTWDFDKMGNIFGGNCNLPSGSPAVVLSAEMNDNVVVSAYDTRMGRRETPAIYAVWRPRRGKVVGEFGNGGIDGALTVGDLRNVKAPLGEFTVTDLALS